MHHYIKYTGILIPSYLHTHKATLENSEPEFLFMNA